MHEGSHHDTPSRSPLPRTLSPTTTPGVPPSAPPFSRQHDNPPHYSTSLHHHHYPQHCPTSLPSPSSRAPVLQLQYYPRTTPPQYHPLSPTTPLLSTILRYSLPLSIFPLLTTTVLSYRLLCTAHQYSPALLNTRCHCTDADAADDAVVAWGGGGHLEGRKSV